MEESYCVLRQGGTLLICTVNRIPKTIRGKEFLKRVFSGQLVQLPEEIEDGIADYTPPVLLSSDSVTLQYKVLYAVARAQ